MKAYLQTSSRMYNDEYPFSTHKHRYAHTHTHTDTQTDTLTHTGSDRQAGRQADRQTDGRTDGQTSGRTRMCQLWTGGRTDEDLPALSAVVAAGARTEK